MFDSLVESVVAIAEVLYDIVTSAVDAVFGNDDDDNFPPMIPVAYG